MVLSFLLHLYQPPWQHAYVISEIANSCYLPLLKLIKNKKEFKVTLNCPLSLLEWCEKGNLSSFISDLGLLRDQGRVELTGCAAYHPILTKIPLEEVERQVILNESGLSYYLGRTVDFEGEPSLMIKDVRGFFPPELAINSSLVEVLNGLAYEWVVVDEPAITEKHELNQIDKIKGTSLSAVVRNRDLSLCLAFSRDSSPKEFMEGIRYLAGLGIKYVFIVLDGESFGHHNKEGIELLENVIEALSAEGHVFETVSPLVEEFKVKREIEVKESSWGASEADMAHGNFYPRWYLSNNKIHEGFMKLEKVTFEVVREASAKVQPNISGHDLANLPIWDFNKVSLARDLTEEQKAFLKAGVLLDKALNSDKYWWSYDEATLEANVVKRSLEIFMKIVEKFPNANPEYILEMKKARDEILGHTRALVPEK